MFGKRNCNNVLWSHIHSFDGFSQISIAVNMKCCQRIWIVLQFIDFNSVVWWNSIQVFRIPERCFDVINRFVTLFSCFYSKIDLVRIICIWNDISHFFYRDIGSVIWHRHHSWGMFCIISFKNGFTRKSVCGQRRYLMVDKFRSISRDLIFISRKFNRWGIWCFFLIIIIMFLNNK